MNRDVKRENELINDLIDAINNFDRGSVVGMSMGRKLNEELDYIRRTGMIGHLYNYAMAYIADLLEQTESIYEYVSFLSRYNTPNDGVRLIKGFNKKLYNKLSEAFRWGRRMIEYKDDGAHIIQNLD